MLGYLRKATAAQARALGPFIDDTDFKTAKTALTIANTDILLSVNGAATAAKNSGGGTHRANGVYGVTFDATDTATVGELFVTVKVATALAVFGTYHVIEAAIYDALFAASAGAGTAALPANVTNIAGAAVSATTAQLGVNVVNAAGTAWGSGAITAASIAASALTAAKFATDALDANALAANAASEIGTAVWATAARTLTANTNLNDLSAAGVRAAVGLATANLDTQIATLSTLNAAGVRSAVGLASANLDTQLAAIAGYIDTEIATIITNIAALNNISAATVKAQVVAALATDTYPEAGVPAATASLAAKIGWLMTLSRNKLLQTAAVQTVRNDGDSADLATSAVSDDGTTFTRAKFV